MGLQFGLTYQQALNALDEDNTVARQGWMDLESGPKVLLARPGSAISQQFINLIGKIPNSLSDYVKQNDEGDIDFAPDFAIIHVNSNTIENKWESWDEDSQATDWGIIE